MYISYRRFMQTFVFFSGFLWEDRAHCIDFARSHLILSLDEKVLCSYEAYRYERGKQRKQHHE